jgi:hypothetical protein
MENPEKYGFDLKKIELYKPFQTESVSVAAPIENLALWAKERQHSQTNSLAVYFIGIGEKLEDLQGFKADEFAQALIS